MYVVVCIKKKKILVLFEISLDFIMFYELFLPQQKYRNLRVMYACSTTTDLRVVRLPQVNEQSRYIFFLKKNRFLWWTQTLRADCGVSKERTFSKMALRHCNATQIASLHGSENV